MLVKDLIELLQKLPENSEVWVSYKVSREGTLEKPIKSVTMAEHFLVLDKSNNIFEKVNENKVIIK